MEQRIDRGVEIAFHIIAIAGDKAIGLVVCGLALLFVIPCLAIGTLTPRS